MFNYHTPFVLTTSIINSLKLGKLFVHNEGSNILEGESFSKFGLSKCIYAQKSDIINFLDGQTGYVALPVYQNKSFADFQLAVTGSIGTMEFPEEASVREIQEEIGLFTCNEDIIKSTYVKNQKKDLYLHIHKLATCEPARHINSNPGEDDRSQKVISWVVLNDPKDIIKRKRIQSNDTAGNLVIVAAISDIIKLLKHFF